MMPLTLLSAKQIKIFERVWEKLFIKSFPKI